MKRSHGPNSKRSRNLRSKGRVPITKQLQAFNVGDRVRLDANPAEQRGKPSTLRFNKRAGEIAGKQGDAYRVKFKDKDKTKYLVVSNKHLVKTVV